MYTLLVVTDVFMTYYFTIIDDKNGLTYRSSTTTSVVEDFYNDIVNQV